MGIQQTFVVAAVGLMGLSPQMNETCPDFQEPLPRNVGFHGRLELEPSALLGSLGKCSWLSRGLRLLMYPVGLILSPHQLMAGIWEAQTAWTGNYQDNTSHLRGLGKSGTLM